MLTRRGWSLFGAATGLYAGSRILGLVQLTVLAASAALLLGGAVTWVRRHPVSLDATRSAHERLQVGVEGRVDLSVTVLGARSTPTLAVADAFDRGRRTARFLVPPLRAGETARAAYRVPTERRGRYELGPLRCTITDPFGLAQRTARLLDVDEVIVHPRVHDVLALPEVGGDEFDRDRPLVHGRADTSGEFHTLREHAPGDDLRRVHWRSTARRDRLMVRQDESRRRSPVLVMLDIRPGAHDRESFERAVECTASIVAALERDGRAVELITSAGAQLGTHGRRHLTSVLDELAVIQPHGPDRLSAALVRRSTGALVAVMGRVRDNDLGAFGMLVRGGGLLAIVATRAQPDAAVPHGRRVRPLLVVTGIDLPFPAAWNESVLLWLRSARRLQPTSHSRA